MNGVIGEILQTWTQLTDWFTESIGSITDVFYSVDGGLTFLGALTILSIALGVATMIVSVVRSYLQMRA